MMATHRPLSWLALLWLLLPFWACLGESREEFRTRYTVNLSVIDPRLTLDSAQFLIYVEGRLPDSLRYTAADLQDRRVAFSTPLCAEGDSVRVVYSVWSQGFIVAQGSDAFVMSASVDDSRSALVLDDERIATLTAALPGSSSAGASSSSSLSDAVAACGSDTGFSIGFATATATLTEGNAVISLLLGGTRGARLAAPRTVTLTVNSGKEDVELSATVRTLQTGDSACTVYEVPVRVVEDNLVEGTESAEILITSFGDGLVPGAHPSLALTLLDRDSAWISLAFPDTVTETDASQSIAGVATLHTTRDARLSKASAFSLVATGGSAVAGKDYRLDSPVQFAAGSQEGSTVAVSWTLLGDDLWEPLDSLELRASGTAFVDKLAPVRVWIADDEREYLVLVYAQRWLLINPEGQLAWVYDASNVSYFDNDYLLAVGVGKDSLLVLGGGGLFSLARFSAAPSIAPIIREEGFSDIQDLDGWSVPNSSGCRSIVSVGSRKSYFFDYCSDVSLRESGLLTGLAGSRAVVADPASTSSNPVFYVASASGLSRYQKSGAGFSSTFVSTLAYGTNSDLAVSSDGVVLSYEGVSKKLYANSAVLDVAGWSPGAAVKVQSTPRNTFWLFTVVSGKLTLTEIDAQGKILRGPLIKEEFPNTLPISVTYMYSNGGF